MPARSSRRSSREQTRRAILRAARELMSERRFGMLLSLILSEVFRNMERIVAEIGKDPATRRGGSTDAGRAAMENLEKLKRLLPEPEHVRAKMPLYDGVIIGRRRSPPRP